jgi:hypothetical protein
MSDKPRILQVFIPLPERETAAERIACMEADVRDAAQQAKRKLEDYAETLSVQGWKPDQDGEYAVWQRNLIGRLRVTR